MQNKEQFYISGEWVEAHSQKQMQVIDPSTEQACATIRVGDDTDIDLAVRAATAAFGDWASTTLEARKQFVRDIQKHAQARHEELAQTISQEMGAPIDMSRRNQAQRLSDQIDAFLETVDDVVWQYPLRPDNTDTQVVKEPIGTVGLITPWNWPMNQMALKVIPALLAGCTCVLKPSEEAPLSAMLFAEFVHAANLPAGVFNLVNGDGIETGRALTRHPDVRMISFTGSTAAGRDISRNAAEHLKKVTLELGGKGATIAFADASADDIAKTVRACFENTGQTCKAPTRLLVERSIYETTLDQIAAVADACPVGSAHDQGDHIGPVVSERQWHRVQGFIQSGIDDGARLIAGGLGKPVGHEVGYFVKPTIFADVRRGSEIEQSEIFGPVLCVMPFDTEDQAIEIANDTAYGLTNYVLTQDTDRKRRVALALRSGMVELNHSKRGRGAPFGGVKMSGLGREGGVVGIEEFLTLKTISGWD